MDLEVSAFGTGATGLDEENARAALDDENARSGVDEERPRSGLEEHVLLWNRTGNSSLDIAEISAAVALNSISSGTSSIYCLFLEEESSSFRRLRTRLFTESSLSGFRTSCIRELEVGTGEDSDITGLL